MNTSAVRYGSLAIPPAAKELVDGAFAYLRRDAVERALIRRVERSPVRHRIVVNHRGDDSYQPSTHTIRWDPTSAMRTTHGGRQSPALGLAHEIDHAVQAGGAYDVLQAIEAPRYEPFHSLSVYVLSGRASASSSTSCRCARCAACAAPERASRSDAGRPR